MTGCVTVWDYWWIGRYRGWFDMYGSRFGFLDRGTVLALTWSFGLRFGDYVYGHL